MHQVFIDPALKNTIKDLSLEDFLTFSYCILDEIYQFIKPSAKRRGSKPIFSDIEVICLNIVGQFFCDSEKAWHGFVKKNYLHLFPHLVERSRYHRRCKDLQKITELLRYHLLNCMDVNLQNWHIIDSLPVPVCVYARASRNLRFATDFQVDNSDLYGHCASKKEDIYGFKLHLMVTTQGIPTNYVLAPAAHHDVVVAPELLESCPNKVLTMGDKGYVGVEKRLTNQENHDLIIQKRQNQKPNTNLEKAFLGIFRKTIETVNSLLTEQMNIQYTRAKSAWGLTNRIIAKITALTFAIYLNYRTEKPILQVKNLIF